MPGTVHHGSGAPRVTRVTLPLIVAAGAAMLVPAARAALLAIPVSLLIGLNIARAIGGFFLLLRHVGERRCAFPFCRADLRSVRMPDGLPRLRSAENHPC